MVAAARIARMAGGFCRMTTTMVVGCHRTLTLITRWKTPINTEDGRQMFL